MFRQNLLGFSKKPTVNATTMPVLQSAWVSTMLGRGTQALQTAVLTAHY
jgi:hypothetical protein